MTTLQEFSLISLWVAIIAEGILLAVLYRHMARRYAPRSQGLAVGMAAPPLLVHTSSGKDLTLPELLTADHILLVFGSPTCQGCRAFLNDQEVHRFLTAQALPTYFLTTGSIDETIAKVGTNPFFSIFSASKNTFEDYAVPSMPFAYIVAQTGTVAAQGPIGGGLPSLKRLLDQLSHGSTIREQAPVQIAPPIRRASR